jgi:hypothetical protein
MRSKAKKNLSKLVPLFCFFIFAEHLDELKGENEFEEVALLPALCCGELLSHIKHILKVQRPSIFTI